MKDELEGVGLNDNALCWIAWKGGVGQTVGCVWPPCDCGLSCPV